MTSAIPSQDTLVAIDPPLSPTVICADRLRPSRKAALVMIAKLEVFRWEET